MAKRKGRKRTTRRTRNSRRKKNQSLKKYSISALLILIIGLVAFWIGREYIVEPESFESDKYFVKGIDVSHHNPILNWDIVMEQGISFAYIKATEGTSHLDRNYPYNYELAKKTNIHVGSYHFYTFGLSGKEQAQHFLNTAKFQSGDLRPVIDVEHSTANPYSKDDKYVASVINELKVLENELYEHFGVHPIIYTNKDCYKLYVKSNFPDNFVWICDLENDPSDYMKDWKIWQFSHKGELPGVIGNIDLNYYRYSFEEFKELLLP